MKRLLTIVISICALMVCSCSSTPQSNAGKVAKAINNYCNVVESAISDEVIDDEEVAKIKESEKEYTELIKSITESYKDDANGLAEFQQAMYGDKAWNRMADLCYTLAETEGYVKLSLTE